MAQSAASRATKLALKRLNSAKAALSSQQYKTIRGQIIAGDLFGADKGLRKILPAIFIMKEEIP